MEKLSASLTRLEELNLELSIIYATKINKVLRLIPILNNDVPEQTVSRLESLLDIWNYPVEKAPEEPARKPQHLQQPKTPVVRQDNDVLSFAYSRNGVSMQYTIRCDVDSVNTGKLLPEFKAENCVYPLAYSCPNSRGNRLPYETECNTVAWALAQLNPSLQGERGLLQRVVDSWRNSNPELQSRRVRRTDKKQRRARKGLTST
jgi:hypothetical protein